MRWAIVNLENNTVENVIIWDGNDYFFPFPVEKLIKLDDNERCGPGYGYDPNSSPRFFEINTNNE